MPDKPSRGGWRNPNLGFKKLVYNEGYEDIDDCIPNEKEFGVEGAEVDAIAAVLAVVDDDPHRDDKELVFDVEEEWNVGLPGEKLYSHSKQKELMQVN